MRMNKLELGLSIADTSYPSIFSGPGEVRIEFKSSQGVQRSIQFVGVPAFHWQEAEIILAQGEPWDGAFELYGTKWLEQHSAGGTIYSATGLRHLRLNFNAWGHFEVLCTTFKVNA